MISHVSVLVLLQAALMAQSAASPSACGEGVGDLRSLAASQEACKACQGELQYDMSAAEGLGYTACAGAQASQQQQQQQSRPPASVTCGEGVGDLRSLAASQEACKACQGELQYDMSAAEGLGYTVCSGAQLPQQQESNALPQPVEQDHLASAYGSIFHPVVVFGICVFLVSIPLALAPSCLRKLRGGSSRELQLEEKGSQAAAPAAQAPEMAAKLDQMV